MTPDNTSPKRCTIDLLLDDVSMLISPPEILIRLHQVMDSPLSSTKALAIIVAQDPNLSARVLRIANSSVYGLSQRVDTVSRAITVIGTRGLYHLSMAVTAAQSFSQISSSLVNIAVFWRHSVFSALIARNLARRCRILHPERLFVAGLLHDIGSLLIYKHFAESLQDIVQDARGNEQHLAEYERQHLGFDHAEVGAALLKRWGLPETLYTAVGSHHAYDHLVGQTPMSLEAAIVHLADALSNRRMEGSFSEFGAYASHIDASAWQILGLDEGIVDEVWAEVGRQFIETLEAILPSAYV